MHLLILDLLYTFGGKEDHLFPVVLQSNEETILVDCGYAGFMPLLDEALHQQGLSLDSLTGLLITHHDIDHMGCAYELKQVYPRLKIYTSVWEEPYVTGQSKSLRLQQAEDLFDSLSEEQKPGALVFQELLKTMQPVAVDAVFADNEAPAVLPGVQIIHTPGHMPGHISLYLNTSRTLIAADALVYQDGQLDIANPAFTLDLPEAIASVKKIQTLNVSTIICYHGGIVSNGVALQLEQLMGRYRQ